MNSVIIVHILSVYEEVITYKREPRNKKENIYIVGNKKQMIVLAKSRNQMFEVSLALLH